MDTSYPSEPSGLPHDDHIGLIAHRYLQGSASQRRYRKDHYAKTCPCYECSDEYLNRRREQAPNRLYPSRTRNEARRHRQLHVDALEGEELAREGRLLTNSAHHAVGAGTVSLKKRPSLRREGAFRDQSTSKTSTAATAAASSRGQTTTGLTGQETEELYRLGILYDDEHTRGSGFDFSVIDRANEPGFRYYAISPRPAKTRPRRRRRGGRGRKVESLFEEIVWDQEVSVGRGGFKGRDIELALELSFSDLGSDEAIARFMVSNSDSDFIGPPMNERELGHSRSASQVTKPSVTVIYEVNGVDHVPELEDLPELGDEQDDDDDDDHDHDHDEETRPQSQDGRHALLHPSSHFHDTDSDSDPDDRGNEELDPDADGGEEGWEDVLPEPAISSSSSSSSTTTTTLVPDNESHDQTHNDSAIDIQSWVILTRTQDIKQHTQ